MNPVHAAAISAALWGGVVGALMGLGVELMRHLF
jgi:hypothetical protein